MALDGGAAMTRPSLRCASGARDAKYIGLPHIGTGSPVTGDLDGALWAGDKEAHMKSNVKTLEEIRNVLIAVALLGGDPRTLTAIAQALGIDWRPSDGR